MNHEEEICQLADFFYGRLDEFHVDAVKDYVGHGENILALEMLCDFLGDGGVVLNVFEYQEISRLGAILNLDINDARFTYLRTLVMPKDSLQNTIRRAG